MPDTLDDKLNLLSFDVVLAVCYAQGPARAVQLVAMACHELADHTEDDEAGKQISLNLAEIADNLERYAQHVLDHMAEVQFKKGGESRDGS